MLLGDGVFGEVVVGGVYFVEGGDVVIGFEFKDVGVDGVDYVGDVIVWVGVGVLFVEVGEFLVFWVGVGDDDVDEDVVWGGEGGDGGVNYFDLRVFVDEGFFYFWLVVVRLFNVD